MTIVKTPDREYRLGEPGLRMSHNLDWKYAGIFNNRFIVLFAHLPRSGGTAHYRLLEILIQRMHAEE